MNYQLVDLQSVPQHLPRLATWHHQQWGYLNPGLSLADRERKMQAYLQEGAVPSTFVAIEGTNRLGSAALVQSDMDTHPDLGPWLASVYVAPEHRGRGLGEALVRRVVAEAQTLLVSRLYLFTPDQAGFYRRLGWHEHSTEIYRGTEVTIMVYQLKGAGA